MIHEQRAHETDKTVINMDRLCYAGNLETLAEVADSSGYPFEKVDICNRRGKLPCSHRRRVARGWGRSEPAPRDTGYDDALPAERLTIAGSPFRAGTPAGPEPSVEPFNPRS